MSPRPTSPARPLPPGVIAPDFTLNSTPDQKLSLSDFRGRPVVLVFYPSDWSPVSSDQLSIYNALLGEFSRYGAQLVGISVDGVWCHLAFAEHHKLHFPLLADFEPKGAVARSYGVYREREGFCDSALFVLDEEGRVAWSSVTPLGVNPGVEGILEALEALQAPIHLSAPPEASP